MNRLQLTPTQIKELKSIKNDDNLMTNVAAFATAVGITPKQAYYKRWTLLNKAKSTKLVKTILPKTKATRIRAIKPGKKIKAYSLELNPAGAQGGRGDNTSLEQLMQNVVKPRLLAMQINKHTLPIPKRDISAVRRLFKDPALTNMVFTIKKISDNTGYMRIARKA